MRFFIPFFLPFLLPFLAKAQTVSGHVTGENGIALSNATLAVRSLTDSAVLKYTLTDAQGRFRITGMPVNEVLLQCSYAGYGTKDTLLTLAGDVELNLQLTPIVADLRAVTVTAAKPLFDVQADKMVFNVSQTITGAGGNALELLQKSPGVLVDPNDGISMNGKTGVRVYIDGRPSPLSLAEVASLLRTIPASDVEAIEIITNPSARYEAAGNAGIINIRLKKNRSFGTNGTMNTSWAAAVFPKYNGSLGLNHRSKKVNLFSNYSYNQGTYEGYLNLFRYQNDSLFDQRSTTISQNKAHNLKLGADWFLNPRQTLGILVNVNSSSGSSETNSSTPIAAQNSKEVAQTLQAYTTGSRRRNNLSANLNYRFADTAGRELSMDLDYSHYTLDGQSATQNRYADAQGAVVFRSGFSSQTPVGIRFAALQAAWEQKLWGGTLGAGLRLASAKTDNTFSFFNFQDQVPVFDQMRSNRFAYTEEIYAAYAQYNRQVKKWRYQAGLRLEQTASLGELSALVPSADKSVKRRYLNLFPSAGIGYQLHANHQLGVSFSRRIDRPSYQDLNPFENRIDELTYQKGNPFLRPQFTNNFELRHTYKYKLTTTLGYTDVQDFFAAITDTIEGRRNFITQQNIARQRIYSLSASLPFRITKWWSGFANAGVSHNRYRAQFEPGKAIRINNTVANIYQQHTFTLHKRWSAELSSFYLSPYVWAGNYECRSIWNIDAGVQYKVLNNQGTVKLAATDIFHRMPWTGTSRLGSLLIVGSGGWESRQVRLSFSYRFGNSEVKGARQRNTGVEDLNRRVQ
jgi:outer membrane receptor protein involved in Fe transport